jgi:hypothetical protein
LVNIEEENRGLSVELRIVHDLEDMYIEQRSKSEKKRIL